jgi:undecaprenyl-diphosphatase
LVICRHGWRFGWTLVLAGLVGLSRIVVGVHYPLDIVGGALLGALCGILLARVAAWWEIRRAPRPASIGEG